MSKLKKIVIIFASTVASIIMILYIALVAFWGIYNGGFLFLAPNYNKMDRFVKANNEELLYVSDVLSELDYDTIEICKYLNREEYDYNMEVRIGKENKTVPIPDELVSHIEALYNNGVSYIRSSQDSINFTMWSTMEESRGIEYSRTGEKPYGEQLIEVRQLSCENWFYYVHNYYEAKERNPELFE